MSHIAIGFPQSVGPNGGILIKIADGPVVSIVEMPLRHAHSLLCTLADSIARAANATPPLRSLQDAIDAADALDAMTASRVQ